MVAHAEESAKQVLESFFSGLKTLTATFQQTVQNPQLNTTENASGLLWIERPGKFRWNYEKPYLQEIVSNGEKVWIFDADLEQVTIKQVNNTLGNTPAVLLSTDKPISDTFSFEEMDKGLRLKWVELKPKDTEAGFNGIQLGFNKTQLEEMLLEDNLGQLTRLIFSDVSRNQTLDSDLFNFIPPKNADIFDSSK